MTKGLLLAALICFVLFAWRWLAIKGKFYQTPMALLSFIRLQPLTSGLTFALVFATVMSLLALSK